jgi:hypothetical protein
MDNFIRGDFRLSVENHFCQAYSVSHGDELVAVFALSFDSFDLAYIIHENFFFNTNFHELNTNFSLN